jgi:hypothetical protein
MLYTWRWLKPTRHKILDVVMTNKFSNFYVRVTVHRRYVGKTPTRCDKNAGLLTQHVSGTSMPIIRSTIVSSAFRCLNLETLPDGRLSLWPTHAIQGPQEDVTATVNHRWASAADCRSRLSWALGSEFLITIGRVSAISQTRRRGCA